MNFMVESDKTLETFDSRSIFHLWERIQGCFVNFRERRSHRCCSQCPAMLKSNRVHPEIQMAKVIPETHVARTADLE